MARLPHLGWTVWLALLFCVACTGQPEEAVPGGAGALDALTGNSYPRPTPDGLDCSWPAPAFFGDPVLTEPSLPIELGKRSAPGAAWAPLADGDPLEMFHGVQGSFHSFALFRVAPGASALGAGAPLAQLKLQTEVWLADGCGVIAAGQQPTVFATLASDAAGQYGNTEDGTLGVQIFFEVPSYLSVTFDGRHVSLYVRVRVAGTQVWGEVAVPVVLLDTKVVPTHDASADAATPDAEDASAGEEAGLTPQEDIAAVGEDAAVVETAAENSDGDTGGDSSGEDTGSEDAADDTKPTGETDAGPDNDVAGTDFVAVVPKVVQLEPLGLTPSQVPTTLGLAASSPCAPSGYFDGDDHLDGLVVSIVPALGNALQINALLARPAGPQAVSTALAESDVEAVSGCTAVDLNDDGVDDLVVAGPEGLRGFVNDGKGGFALDPALFAKAPVPQSWTAAPVDLDGDGDLDLFVGLRPQTACSTTGCGQASACKNTQLKTKPSTDSVRVLIRLADGFVDATAVWLEALPLGAATAAAGDGDGDGRDELWAADLLGVARVWRRAGDEYEPLPAAEWVGSPQRTGWAFLDLDGDVQAEVVGSGLGAVDVVQPPVKGAAAKSACPLGWESLSSWTADTESWSPIVADLNHDGRQDVYLGIADGAVSAAAPSSCDPAMAETVADLIVLGQGATKQVQLRRGPVEPCGRQGAVAQSTADLDLDGDLDVLQVRPGCSEAGEPRLLTNTAASGKAITVRVKGPPGNRDGFGARIQATVAGVPQMQLLTSVTGVGSSGPRLGQIGLGGALQADNVKVVFADGAVASLGSLSPGKVHVAQWTPPVPAAAVPIDSLPDAALTDVTDTLGLPKSASWMPCAVVGRSNKDAHDDLVLLGKHKGGQYFVYTKPLGGTGPSLPYLQNLVAGPIVPSVGCSMLDTDVDGDDDLIVAGQPGIALLRNDGGQFVWDDTTLAAVADVRAWSIAAADYDRDGDVDLYVGSGVAHIPCDGFSCSYQGADASCSIDASSMPVKLPKDHLLLQTSPGKYEDASLSWGVPNSLLLSRAFAHDVDNDGWMDVVVGNDFAETYVLRNTGKGGFVQANVQGLQKHSHGMGWASGDLDLDGDLDLVQADVGPVEYYRRLPAPLPDAMPSYAMPSVQHPFVGWTWDAVEWAPLIDDLDLDGTPDLFLGVSMDFSKIDPAEIASCGLSPLGIGSRDLWFHRTPAGSWSASASPVESCGAWGAMVQSLVDLDNDGGLDIVQVRPNCSLEQHVRALRNELTVPKPALDKTVRVLLQGKAGNARAYGARLFGKRGGKTVEAEVAQSGLLGSTASRGWRFAGGLALEDVKVRWPDGTWTEHGTLAPGSLYILQQTP